MAANWWGISATALAWLGIAVIALALLAPWIVQRIKRLRRCPKCWYDLSHSPPPAMTCSECGYTVKRERKLYKARRRWRFVALGMFMLIGAHALNITPEVKDRGWVAAVPTTVLIVAMPWLEVERWWVAHWGTPAEQDAVTQARIDLLKELYDRMSPDRMWWWQRHALIWWAARWTRTPVGSSYNMSVDASGMILFRALGEHGFSNVDRLISNEAFDRYLAKVRSRYVDDLVEMREHWPRDYPIEATMHRSAFFLLPGVRVVTATPALQDLAPMEHRSIFLSGSARLEPEWKQFVLGIPPPDVTEIEFDVDIRELRRHVTELHRLGYRVGRAESGRQIWSRRISKPIRIAEHLDEVIEPVLLPEFEQLLRDHAQVTISPFHLAFPSCLDATLNPDLFGLGVVVAGEVLIVADNGVIARGEFTHRRMPRPDLTTVRDPLRSSLLAHQRSNFPHHLRVSLNGPSGEILRRADYSDPSLRVIIRSDRTRALKINDATRAWEGEVVLPVRVILEDR